MKQRFLLVLSLLVWYALPGFSQGSVGEITGRILDDSKQGIPFANVAVERNGVIISGATTDFEGFFTIKPLDPGLYDVRATYVGYNPSLLTGVRVIADKITDIGTIQLAAGDVILGEIEIIEYKVPLIDKADNSTKNTITQEEIKNLPTKNITSIASQTAGVYQSDEGKSVNIKGGRTEATEYFIDGIRVRGNVALPPMAIEQVTVVTGGIPAKYGDMTGGVINITTRGPSRTYNGGVEASTSEFLDAFGYNDVVFNLSGPLLSKNRKSDNKEPILGFLISGHWIRERDANPSAVGMWKVKDEKLDFLERNPLAPAPSGTGYVLNSESLTFDDMERIKAKQNVVERNYRLAGNFNLKASDNITLAFGGSGTHVRRHDWVDRYSLLNHENNPFYNETSYRFYGRFTQKFKTALSEDGQPTSPFQNAFYSIQFDYSKVYDRYEDDDHGTRAFDYGYIGQMRTLRRPLYQYGTDSLTGKEGFLMIAEIDTLIEYKPATFNPKAVAYTESYYQLNNAVLGPDGFYTTPERGAQIGLYNNLDFIRAGNALLNGDRPNSHIPYGIWYNTGRQFNGYGIDRDNDQYRLTVNGSVDILRPGASSRNKHAIEFGFEFEQRVDRTYRITPIGLWTLMRQLTNAQLLNFDLNNPILLIDGETYAWNDPNAPAFGQYDTIMYNRLYVEGDQTHFDRKLREALGIPVNGTSLIDIDNIDPSSLSLDMFSADELLNNGSSYVYYYGYDHTGKKLRGQTSFNDFFTKKNDEGVYTRPIGAFRPIYSAAYIQDHFYFKDVSFNIGVRVDRYDANQKVLKDPYSLYDIRTVEEVDPTLNSIGAHPGNIGTGYKVYVDDFQNPTRILGYRNGDVWYNAEGTELFDPQIIARSSTTGRITPYLKNPDDDIKSPDFDPNSSFTDYSPQVNVMPRVQFSFNLTDEASFFAHYDVLTQRPQGRLISTPDDWFFFDELSGRINNPNLRPEKTIDYQIGFRQLVSKSSAVTLSAFYREMRDMVQVQQFNFAYPRNYTTYGNRDFGTVKGFSIAYDLRRTGNVTLKANYTMQFAEGTGSDDQAQLNLVNANQPNLRSIFPLNFDSRHIVNVIFDYTYGEGKKYNGPKIKGKEVLANAGFNLNVRARSGEPFTRQFNPTPTAEFTTASRTTLEGSINGSRLPWNYRLDLRVFKDFKLSGGQSVEGKTPRPVYLNVYLWVMNLLNTQNVVKVYSYTGSPSDDGWLNSALGEQSINNKVNPQSYIDLYNAWVDSPNNFSLPRRIRLGAILTF